MRARPSHRGIRHLALHAYALEEMKRFYTQVLGYVVEWEPDPNNVYLTSGTDNLALHRAAAMSADRPRSTAPLDHLGLIVERAADVDAWAEYLGAQGVSLDKPPKTHRDGARSVYFSDPDGNQVQIIYHPSISDTSPDASRDL